MALNLFFGKTLFLKITVLISFGITSNLQTEACGLSANTYCLNDRQFISCGPLTPGGQIQIFTCPTSEQFCADIQGTCTSNTSLPRSKYTYCGKCNENVATGHTCTSLNTYRICNDGKIQSFSTHTCPRGQYCNAFSSNSDTPCSYFSGREVLCWKDEEVEIPGIVESTSHPSVSTTELPPSFIQDEIRCSELGEGRYEIQESNNCQM